MELITNPTFTWLVPGARVCDDDGMVGTVTEVAWVAHAGGWVAEVNPDPGHGIPDLWSIRDLRKA